MTPISSRQFAGHVREWSNRPENAELAHPDVAMGQCVDVRDELTEHLKSHGVETRPVTVRGSSGLHTAVMGRTTSGWKVADPTYAQADFGAHPYPYIGHPRHWRDSVRAAMED